MDRYGQYVKASGGGVSRGPWQAADGGGDARGAPADGRAEHHGRLGARAGGDGRSPRRRRRPGAAQHVGQYKPGDAARAGRAGAADRRTGPRLYGGTELTAVGRAGRGRVQAGGQPALQLSDHQHPLRLDVRRSGQPHHAEQGHHRPPVRPDGAEADVYMNQKDASGQRQAEPRRPLDRPLGG